MPKVLAKTSRDKPKISDDNGEELSSPSLKESLFSHISQSQEDSEEMSMTENPDQTVYATDSDDNDKDPFPLEDPVSPVYKSQVMTWKTELTSDLPEKDKRDVVKRDLGKPNEPFKSPLTPKFRKFRLRHNKSPGLSAKAPSSSEVKKEPEDPENMLILAKYPPRAKFRLRHNKNPGLSAEASSSSHYEAKKMLLGSSAEDPENMFLKGVLARYPPKAKFRLRHNKNPGFTTATGKPMAISSSSKAKVLHLFEDEIDCNDVQNEDFPDDFPEIPEAKENPENKRPLSPVSSGLSDNEQKKKKFSGLTDYELTKMKTICKQDDVIDALLDLSDLMYISRNGKESFQTQLANLSKEHEVLKKKFFELENEMFRTKEEVKQLKDQLEKYTTLLLLNCNSSPDDRKKSGFFVGGATSPAANDANKPRI